ncbi:gastrula zinc finger protein XlCGF8.2DB-like [Macrosteles quadrilineatus]|uniref:gastrula zinc finger protein XlCGF8.2DB-like n=1 Tax=Macrosteles quadrilineatus TaxID=74068 RepID=UPI0023E1724E|nr:gastrula zinc finger protein XlCGF8.2DB-like [Macrosteles quadrilineatus]
MSCSTNSLMDVKIVLSDNNAVKEEQCNLPNVLEEPSVNNQPKIEINDRLVSNGNNITAPCDISKIENELKNEPKRKPSKKTASGCSNLDKKHGKKSKHKKYEKPSDQIVKLYPCTSCPKVFQRPSSFKAHQRTHNPLTARPFSCMDCKNTFIYRCQLRDHIRTHTGERPFKCHSCSKSFARKPCLVAHMVTHSDTQPFQCDVCCKRFGRKYNLAKHMQSHSGERPFGCLSCSRRFKCKQSLDKHHRIHELNIYSCAVCHMSFDTKRHLTQHKINEHVSYRPFTCQICQKPFIFKSQLTYHIKEHNLERPYSCRKCNKSYFKKGHLLSHIKQYCGDYESESQIKMELS